MHERIAELSCNALRAGDAAEATARIAAHGFDAVLARDTDGHDTRDPAALATIVAACRTHGLALWVVVGPDASGAPLFNAQASPPVEPWLVDSDAALDPRRPPLDVRSSPFREEEIDGDAWRTTIDDAIAAGVTGFVCRDADRLPDALWSTLTVPSMRWIAWTPGLTAKRVSELVDVGFDTVCSSLAWWDGRGRWLIEELAAAPRAMTLAFPIDPFSRAEDDSTLPLEARLRLAALLGDALLVPQSVWDDAETSTSVAMLNRWLAQRPADTRPLRQCGLRQVTGAGSPLTALVRAEAPDLRGSTHARIALINPDPAHSASVDSAPVTTALSGFGAFAEILASTADTIDPCTPVTLDGGACRLFTATRLPAIERPLPTGRRSTDAALKMPRLAIEAITPSVDDGRFPVKRTAGEAVRVEADIVIDGHEQLAAALLYRAAGETEWQQTRMEAIGNDRYAARFALDRIGRHEFTIEAWRDVFASYRHELDKKAAAGLDVTLELTEGRLLVEQAVEHAKSAKNAALAKRLAALVKNLAHARPLDGRAMATRVAALLSSQTLADMQAADAREFAYRPAVVYPVDAERSEASFASWYELFPRSLGNAPGQPANRHGTFDDVIERLPAVKAMGFDVLYFPPIHPIGTRNRKGRNNSLTALDDDPGSPYAIGSADGGHDALHPELGTFEDFRRMRDAALEHGLELALDFAIQCSPDHPWLQDHPGWFAWRPDGSLRYAENPPKKYEDIVNVDFYGRGRGKDAAPALWAALRDVILLWVEQGVRIFRVDNPHTKPLPFWEWMIGEVRAKYPDTIFLSEAFTRPKVMYRLAKIGFSQSYTYFTWRHTKQEFIDYVTELTTTAPRDFFRPNFFVNTPDINPVFLQRSGRAGFLIRAALASMLSGLWGVYSGFELCEATPVPGKEDYLDSEKYQLRAWDWQRPGHIIGEITALNRIRRENPALRTHLNTRFEVAHDPNILYFAKATEDLSNVILVAINLDPYGVHEADFEVPLWRWGKPDDASVDVTDLLDGHAFRWTGKVQRMRLDPAINPYAIWRVAL